MRTADNIGMAAALEYEDDDGVYVIYCCNCGDTFRDTSDVGSACHCPNCDTELFYRTSYSW